MLLDLLLEAFMVDAVQEDNGFSRTVSCFYPYSVKFILFLNFSLITKSFSSLYVLSRCVCENTHTPFVVCTFALCVNAHTLTMHYITNYIFRSSLARHCLSPQKQIIKIISNELYYHSARVQRQEQVAYIMSSNENGSGRQPALSQQLLGSLILRLALRVFDVPWWYFCSRFNNGVKARVKNAS